jgi:hypothetical protein
LRIVRRGCDAPADGEPGLNCPGSNPLPDELEELLDEDELELELLDDDELDTLQQVNCIHGVSKAPVLVPMVKL